jgi:uncharacterized protein (TIGR02246 family)
MFMRHISLTLTLILAATLPPATPAQPRHHARPTTEEEIVRATVSRFFEGWNAHDADKMVSVYAVDIDHIDVFGEWHKGRETMRAELARLHAGPLRTSQKKYTIEKVRFIKPDVAVVQVSSMSQNGPNLGTFVLEKQPEGWLTVSFTNVAPHDSPWKR